MKKYSFKRKVKKAPEITLNGLALMLVNHKRFYQVDEKLPEKKGCSAEYCEKIIKRVFPNSRKLQQEDMGKFLNRAYGVIYSHVFGTVSAKTAVKKLLEVKRDLELA